MLRLSEEQVQPRNGHTVVVRIGCRISGCTKQKELSNEDQEDHAKERLAELWHGPVEFHVVATKAKGERLVRPELEQIEADYRSKQFDLFIFDDLSRLIRGGEAVRLLCIGVDHGTRTICLNDGIDTIDPTWEEDALNACSENVAHNERTSKRIKQKCMNRFKKAGSPTGRPIASYIVPDGAKSYDEWLKDDAATPIVRAGKEPLERLLDGAPVADFFNAQQFPPGPYARRKDWNGTNVLGLYRNPLLKGWPQRGKKHTVKHHGTGRRKSQTNPKGPTFYHAPRLAHLTEEEFDRLNALLDAARHGHFSDLPSPTSPAPHALRQSIPTPPAHAKHADRLRTPRARRRAV